MTALIIIGVILLIIVMILFLPVHVTAAVKDEAKVFLRILFVRIKLFPMKEKPKKKKKNRSQSRKSQRKKRRKREGKRDIPSLVRSVADILGVFLRQFSKHVKIRVLRYKIIIGTDDAAKTALLYGAAEARRRHIFLRYSEKTQNSLFQKEFACMGRLYKRQDNGGCQNRRKYKRLWGACDACSDIHCVCAELRCDKTYRNKTPNG